MKDVLILDRSNFNNYYGEELLAHLEDIPQIKFDNTLNFRTNTRFEGSYQSRTMLAFNHYLRNLNRTVDRIIIHL